jgi:hypothetical protein
MTWTLQCPDGQKAALQSGEALIAGSAQACPLRLQGAGVPLQLAELSRNGPDAWLCVLETDPPVGLNGRPVQSLARVLPGDRVCFGAFCVDLLGEELAGRRPGRPAQSFALRARGGIGSGELHHGPALYFDADGHIVSAAAGGVSLMLVGDEIRLDPGSLPVRINGHAVTTPIRLEGGDQLQIGPRRFMVEALNAFALEQATQRVPAISLGDLESALPASVTGDRGGLWWLIAMAAVIAAAIAALLYFHR